MPPEGTAGARPSARGARPQATMRDVAALAGVGLKTVSRVVNGEPGVSPALLARVQRAVDQLDYRPNLAASNLRRGDGRTAAIALLLEDLANPYSSTVHRAVEDLARTRGVLVFASSLEEDPQREREMVRALAIRRVDGLIVAPASTDQSYLLRELQDGLPVVFVDRPPRGLVADAVLSTNFAGARDAVTHLAAAGHRRIAYLGDLWTLPTAQERFRGYREALLTLGLAREAADVAHDLHTVEAAAVAAGALLDRPAESRPTALFTSQNLVTIGAIRALQQRRLQHDVALVGFDDFPVADLLEPAVTVVAQDPAAIGRTAAELVFGRLAGEELPAAVHDVATTLLPRGSGEIPPPRP